MKKRFAKRGFTIVEMLMVIAVLAVLTGIVATAATSVIRKSRVRKNEALRAALQTGIATFYQQRGYWPPSKNGTLQGWANDGLDSSERSSGQHLAMLDDDEYDKVMENIMSSSLNASGNKVMDPSGFTAARKAAAAKTGADGQPVCYGEDVRSWVAKLQSKNAGGTPRLPDMTFGYSTSDKGYFRRFRIWYNADSDSVTVEFARANDKNLTWGEFRNRSAIK